MIVPILTLVAALCFLSFHLPIRPISQGKPARLIGIAYHLLLLPAVAILPAPEWAKAAGFAWMLIDAVINGATYAGLKNETGDALRQGVHVLSTVWVVAAGWSGPLYLAVAGTLLGLAFLTRFLLSGTQLGGRAWLRNANAVLNILWMVAVAITLWGENR